MKLCKDCKHFVPNTADWGTERYSMKYAICGLTSKVTGMDGDLCSDRRAMRFFDSCGTSGKLWEAKARTTAARTGERTMDTNWVFVTPEQAKRGGLIGKGDLREMSDCIYRRDENGNWWELQVPPLPVTLPD